MNDIRTALQACPLSAGLAPAQVQVLASLLRLQAVQPGGVLGEEGLPDNRLYAIVEGSLSIVKHRGTPDETVLATLKPGDFAHEPD